MEEEYAKAFAEVSEIIKLMPDELVTKIPKKFKEFLEREKSLEYHPNIKEPILDEQLLPATVIIMGMIYRDFLVPTKEKIMLQEKEAKELKCYYEKLEKQYSTDNLFKNTKKIKENSIKDEVAIVEHKKSIISRILDKIKRLFKRNNKIN